MLIQNGHDVIVSKCFLSTLPFVYWRDIPFPSVLMCHSKLLNLTRVHVGNIKVVVYKLQEDWIHALYVLSLKGYVHESITKVRPHVLNLRITFLLQWLFIVFVKWKCYFLWSQAEVGWNLGSTIYLLCVLQQVISLSGPRFPFPVTHTRDLDALCLWNIVPSHLIATLSLAPLSSPEMLGSLEAAGNPIQSFRVHVWYKGYEVYSTYLYLGSTSSFL